MVFAVAGCGIPLGPPRERDRDAAGEQGEENGGFLFGEQGVPLFQGGDPATIEDPSRLPQAPDLETVIDAWPTLPPATQRAILAIVEAAQGR